MPIYEFFCRNCRTRSSILMLKVFNTASICCQHCGSPSLDRLLSRFAAPKSQEARLASLVDPSNLGAFDEDAPQSVARLVKHLGREMGEDLDQDFGATRDKSVGDVEALSDNDSV